MQMGRCERVLVSVYVCMYNILLIIFIGTDLKYNDEKR